MATERPSGEAMSHEIRSLSFFKTSSERARTRLSLVVASRANRASKGAATVATPRQKLNNKEHKSKHKVSEAQIAVHWKEEAYCRPPAKFIGQANLHDPDFVAKFDEKYFPECFRHYAELLDWDQYWHTTLGADHPRFWQWFVCGKLNACYKCVA